VSGTVEIPRHEFERAFRELVEQHGKRSDNERCIECHGCAACADCTFCKSSKRLVRCNYCVEVEESVDCNHCFGSRALVGCTHCNASERCSRSAYLEQCVDCDDCRYCFGCVGLSSREFHILNRRYEKSEYFKITGQLRRDLGSSVKARSAGARQRA
jgi:hypothetical protein